jgi:signal peptidase I
MSARQSVGDRPARARALPDPPPELEEGVAREAWVLAARMQYEMLAEANEEAERVLREAEQARVALLRSAADLQGEAAAEVERAREARVAAERARGDAEAEASAILEDAARRAERVRASAEDEAARLRADVETEAMARRAELEQELESARASAAERQRAFLAELDADRARLERTAVDQREALLARARSEAEQQRRVMLDEAALRVERVLAEAHAAADQRRAAAEREATEVLRSADEGVEQLQADVIEEGRQEVGRLLARAAAEREELQRAAEAEATRIVAEAEQVATVLRSEAARAYASHVQPGPAPAPAPPGPPPSGRVTVVPPTPPPPTPPPAAESASTGPTRIVTTAGPVPVPGASGASSAPPSMAATAPPRPRRLSAERVRQARARLAGGPATGRATDGGESGDGSERSSADDDRPSPARPLAFVAALPGGLLSVATAPVRLVRPTRRRLRGALADRPRLRLTTHVAAFVLPAFVVAVLVKVFVAQAYYIPSTSMEPQLGVGDRVLVSRLSYGLHEPRRGDVVVFDEPGAEPDQGAPPMRAVRTVLGALGVGTEGDTLVKRVVAVPGETVEGREGRVFVDGRELHEPYLAREQVTSAFGPERVPADHLWVLGDSRENSVDSRSFGPVPVDELEGRAVLRVWPPQRSAFL